MLVLIYHKNQFLAVSSISLFLLMARLRLRLCLSREHGFFEGCFLSHFFIATVMISAARTHFTTHFPPSAFHILRKDQRMVFLEIITASHQATRMRRYISSGPTVWFPVFLQIASSQIALKLNYCKDTGK